MCWPKIDQEGKYTLHTKGSKLAEKGIYAEDKWDHHDKTDLEERGRSLHKRRVIEQTGVLHTVFSLSECVKYHGSPIPQYHPEIEIWKGENKNETHGIYLELGV